MTNDGSTTESGKTAGQDRAGGTGKRHRTPVARFCLILGLFAGLIWGGLRWLLYALSFTGVLPGFLADPFYRRSFLVTWGGHLLGLLFFVLFSIVAAFLYKAVLGRVKGAAAGVVYGLLWWAVLFLWLGPMMHMTRGLGAISWRSLITEACVFAMWGLFIGFSIAFEYTEDASRKHETPLRTLLKP